MDVVLIVFTVFVRGVLMLRNNLDFMRLVHIVQIAVLIILLKLFQVWLDLYIVKINVFKLLRIVLEFIYGYFLFDDVVFVFVLLFVFLFRLNTLYFLFVHNLLYCFRLLLLSFHLLNFIEFL